MGYYVSFRIRKPLGDEISMLSLSSLCFAWLLGVLRSELCNSVGVGVEIVTLEHYGLGLWFEMMANYEN